MLTRRALLFASGAPLATAFVADAGTADRFEIGSIERKEELREKLDQIFVCWTSYDRPDSSQPTFIFTGLAVGNTLRIERAMVGAINTPLVKTKILSSSDVWTGFAFSSLGYGDWPPGCYKVRAHQITPEGKYSGDGNSEYVNITPRTVHL